ncbi:CHAT domain-containing protein [Streptomyces europaeiscabiei]|uniref:CHAT domain-containing protein n=1 Tax=Streptomyces europaeiscabiei TaxID=146819 RepID=UPI002E17D127
MEFTVPTVWWLGYWRAGDKLYWWTTAVSSSADPLEATAAVRARVGADVWRTVTTAPAVSGPQRLASGESGVSQLLLSAGAADWGEVHPLVGRLLAGLPGSVSEETDRRVRELHEQLGEPQGDSGDPDGVKAVARLLEIAVRLRSERNEAKRRAWNGPLVDRTANRDLFGKLGLLLLPPVLRAYLASFRPQETPMTTVVIAPGPELGRIPWELLALREEDDLRAVEVASIRGGLSPASLVDLARPAANENAGGAALRIVDPTADDQAEDAPPIYPAGLPTRWTSESDRKRETVSRGCTREQFGELLNQREWARVLFFGHVESGDAVSPTTSALRFSTAVQTGTDRQPLRADDGRVLESGEEAHALSARVWLHAPNRWPMPRRVALIACEADDSRYVEQAGLTLAAVNAGARIVTTTRWTCPTDQSVNVAGDNVLPGEGATTAMALAVDRAHESADPVAAIRAWQCRQLAAWRSAAQMQELRQAAPLTWACLLTYVLPDTVR